MLQQTQVATVRSYYQKWLKRFPDFATLAKASENDVLHAWQGLGYYNRARHLHATAQIISTEHAGRCPTAVTELRSLPGIGAYTANAIASFAFSRSVPVIDTNVTRSLARLFNVSTPIDKAAGRNVIGTYASQLVATGPSKLLNSALMELGALVCLPRTPRCEICPVKRFCRATNPIALPVKKPRARTKKLAESHLFIVEGGRVLMQKSTKRWRGMWILPRLSGAAKGRRLYASTFPFTQHRIRLRVFGQSCRTIDGKSHRWINIRSLESIPIPSPHRRALNALLAVRHSA